MYLGSCERKNKLRVACLQMYVYSMNRYPGAKMFRKINLLIFILVFERIFLGFLGF